MSGRGRITGLVRVNNDSNIGKISGGQHPGGHARSACHRTGSAGVNCSR